MRRVFIPMWLATIAAWGAQGTEIVGDWRGTLKVGADQIHLTLHIIQGDGDTLKATMDSAEQGAKGVGVTAIAFQDSKLTFTVESVHGTYNGAVNAATGAIEGTWSQGQPTPLVFTHAPKPAGEVKPSELEGIWQGTLLVGGRPLRLVFHITTTVDGLAATMDSPEQGVTAVKVTSARRDGDTLVLQMPNLGAKFQGAVAKDLSAIDGSFTQGGASLPLTLKRNADGK
jgi:D-alanyl-D-alanine-carboxypeptidase/D-alanyl-D-alanine-endopeptidase